ncbi:hypothetical protein ACFLQR_02670 [Verrucomicrobiota bacterium]
MTDTAKPVRAWNIVKAVFVLLGLVAVVYAGLHFVDSRIEKKLEDPALIQSIVSKLRPAVLTDMGATDHAKNLQVVNRPLPLPERVIDSRDTRPTNAPLISPIAPVRRPASTSNEASNLTGSTQDQRPK